jgi:4-methyl-5(b-hydroxyethyl)-thiazole monophosphate biosynthesis
MIHAILAPGFEETEAIAVIDLLRRAEFEVRIYGLEGLRVCGGHDIVVQTEAILPDPMMVSGDSLFLPGGNPGAANLRKSEKVQAWVRQCAASASYLLAICAAPAIVADLHLFAGSEITSHPSVRSAFDDSYRYREESVVCSGQLITSRGVGTAIDFALRIISEFGADDRAKALRHAIVA